MAAAQQAGIEASMKEQVSPWPNWFRSTLSAAVGAAIVFAGVLMYLDKTKADATAALVKTEDHEVRLRSLEKQSADDHAALRELLKNVDELRVDVKVLLQRIPPK